MTGPDPLSVHPADAHPRIVFLKSVVSNPLIEIGDFTYYDDPDGAEAFEAKCVRHHYPFIGDRLVIGRFCALATGVAFVMNGANHAMTGFSTYPFNIFGKGWEQGFDFATISAGFKGDTIVGNDVWIGGEAMVLPGVSIGDGAIVATRSVVSADVPAYSIVAGNPARIVRRRFDEATVDKLLEIRWWDWPVDKITRNLSAIRGADLSMLDSAT